MGLHRWMKSAEALWKEHAEGSKLSLIGRWDYHKELSAQLPLSALRVVYSKAGTIPAAAILRDTKSIVENTLYWTKPNSEDEAHYLAAILNSETSRKRVESMQARGQWGARHFDKVMFNLPIPRFDEKQKLHRDLSAAAKEAEDIAAAVALPDNVKFQRARKLIRDALAEAGISQRIDTLVAQLLDS